MSTIANLYTVLGLPTPTSSSPPTTPQQIKTAYRRALLIYHPDKFDEDDEHSQDVSSKYTVDEITDARNVLLNPTLRHEHDRTLLLQTDGQNAQGFTALLNPTELETVDLDDMAYSEPEQRWTRPCRCGNENAFEVSEDDLIEGLVHEEDGEGELLVGCDGCSLHIRVVFGVAEDDKNDKLGQYEKQESGG